MNIIMAPMLAVAVLGGAFAGYSAAPPKQSVTEVIYRHGYTIATQQTMPKEWKRNNTIAWGNIFRELKIARQPVASITPGTLTLDKVVVKAKPAKRVTKQKAKKRKATCRKGQKLWYRNKKKGRKMYKIRRRC